MQNGAGNFISTMDPTAIKGMSLYDQLVLNFNYNYNNNRAPMGIFVHRPW